MLKRIRLENFRAFKRYTINLKQRNVIVGKNNAGKSTVVEALRIISIVASRAPYLSFNTIRDDADIQLSDFGVVPSLRGTDIDLTNVCHEYSAPPAKIFAYFSSGASIECYLFDDNYIFAILKMSDGVPVSTRSGARRFTEKAVKALPQVGPLQKDERLLKEKSVKENLYTSLAPQHFRNQLNYFENHMETFEKLISEFWQGLSIQELTLSQQHGERPSLNLFMRDGRFVAEVAWMGHGLQVWLQVLWFLSRVKKNETLIVDEPDVYLHADLQRQLIRYMMKLPNQVIVTTHSPEIIAEVSESDILIIDKNNSKSFFANTLPSVQDVLESVGTVQNIYFLRIWSAKCMVFVEGKDISILDKMQARLDSNRDWSIAQLPTTSIGGWGGWKYALGSTVLDEPEITQNLKRYCIFDRDYHIPEEVSERYNEAEKYGVSLHIWSVKEIENFLIVPSCIARIITRHRGTEVSEDYIEKIFFEVSEDLREDIEDNFANEYHIHYKRQGKNLSWCQTQARKLVRNNWDDFEHRRQVVPGKEALSRISSRTQAEFGVSFGVGSILKDLRKAEVHSEVARLIRAIKNLEEL